MGLDEQSKQYTIYIFFWISDEQLEAASDENDLAQQEHMAFAGSNCDKCFSPMSGQRVMSVILSVTLFSVLFNLSRWFELEATQIEVSAVKCTLYYIYH